MQARRVLKSLIVCILGTVEFCSCKQGSKPAPGPWKRLFYLIRFFSRKERKEAKHAMKTAQASQAFNSLRALRVFLRVLCVKLILNSTLPLPKTPSHPPLTAAPISRLKPSYPPANNGAPSREAGPRGPYWHKWPPHRRGGGDRFHS